MVIYWQCTVYFNYFANSCWDIEYSFLKLGHSLEEIYTCSTYYLNDTTTNHNTQPTEPVSGLLGFFSCFLCLLLMKCFIQKKLSSILKILILRMAHSCLLNCLRLLSKKRPKFGVDFLAKNKLVDTLLHYIQFSWFYWHFEILNRKTGF